MSRNLAVTRSRQSAIRPTVSLIAMLFLVVACGTSATTPSQPPATPTVLATPIVAPTVTLSIAPATTPSPDPLLAVRRSIGDLGARLLATVAVGGEPEWIGAGQDAIWVTNARLNAVQRVDPRTNQVVASIPVNQPCNGFAITAIAVWTASCGDQTLVQINPATNNVVSTTPTLVAADGEGQVAAGFGSIWIAGGDGSLRRFDPKTPEQIASIRIPEGADAIATGPTAMWMTDPAGNGVFMIHPDTNKVEATIPTGPHPQFLATDATSVWALNQGDGTVARIDMASQQLVTIATDSLGPDIGCIATGLSATWVTVPGLPITRIDARTNTVTEQLTGAGGDCLATAFGSVWLVNNALGTVYRIGPA